MKIDRPPMGWNSWNTFGADINEQVVMETADAIVSRGLKDAGYEYVIIDDCWALRERGKDGRMVPDPKKFPSGMKALADYVHGKGLKFGIYSCSGAMTCAMYPGSLDHEFVDAQTFAEWGVDYLKYDYCYMPESFSKCPEIMYRRMGLALANCGRDIVFAACTWGQNSTPDWVRTANVHTWRSTGDINDSFGSIKDIFFQQIPILGKNAQGCFTDMDMLVVGMHGNGNVGVSGCSFEEYKLHFSAWALLASPLIIGCDVRNADEETMSILMNKDVIAVNRDAGGRQTYASEYFHDVTVLVRMLDGGDVAVGMFNFNEKKASCAVLLDEFGLAQSTGKTVEFTDLWTKQKTKVVNGTYQTDMEAHGCVLLRGKVTDA